MGVVLFIVKRYIAWRSGVNALLINRLFAFSIIPRYVFVDVIAQLYPSIPCISCNEKNCEDDEITHKSEGGVAPP